MMNLLLDLLLYLRMLDAEMIFIYDPFFRSKCC